VIKRNRPTNRPTDIKEVPRFLGDRIQQQRHIKKAFKNPTGRTVTVEC
jgi:hypothetical protein